MQEDTMICNLCLDTILFTPSPSQTTTTTLHDDVVLIEHPQQQETANYFAQCTTAVKNCRGTNYDDGENNRKRRKLPPSIVAAAPKRNSCCAKLCLQCAESLFLRNSFADCILKSHGCRGHFFPAPPTLTYCVNQKKFVKSAKTKKKEAVAVVGGGSKISKRRRKITLAPESQNEIIYIN